MSALTDDLHHKIKTRKERVAELSHEILVKQDTIRILSKEVEEFEKMLLVLTA